MTAWLVACAGLWGGCALFARQPLTLAESARKIAQDMPRGCIVTGEWRDGDVVYAISGPDQPANVPPEKVVFEIGSISKVFTGLLLAQAVLEKKLTFESTLKEVLDPDQEFADDKVAAITLAQLATHTSGLPRMPDNSDFTVANPYGAYDMPKLRAWIANVTLADPGPHEPSYSNAGVAILGYAIGRALGESWENLVRNRICEPLGMHDTTPTPTAEMRQRLAAPFEGATEAHEWNFQAFAPAGGLRSTAADLMILGHALTHPETSPLRKAIQLAVKPLAQGIGCCFYIQEDSITHGGGTGGYRTLLEAKPQADQVRIVLISNAKVEATNITQLLDRELFKAVEGPRLSETELRPYTGVFRLSKKVKFTFVVREGGLWGKLTGQCFLPYLHEGRDVFFNRDLVARLIFERDATGAITQVTLDQHNRKQLAARLEEQPPVYLFRSNQELEKYIGVYDFAPPEKVITVKLKDDTLYAQITGQQFFPLFETMPGYFEYDVVLASIAFQHDSEGKINRLNLTQNGRRLPALKRTN